ncbi:ABC transporter permease [Bacillus sp. Marseille-Q3570]|uniref:ABC transporter permease n=1 Tax=Bacillus sp. Marseille-Q3570 TaxID=2963522 RepID=UPI0021B75963|nr:ABC transporter permease subunit [Bacillus sp. Marseille-Q3570]
MMVRLLRNPMFLIGALFIIGLFVSSLVYHVLKDDSIPVIGLLHDDDGELVPHPYSPTDHPPFGTEHFGRDLLTIMVIGAKYTLGIAFVTAFLRVFISSVIGVFVGMFVSKTKKLFAWLVDAGNYFPATLLAFFLLIWVLFYEKLYVGEYSLSFAEQGLIIVLVLTAIAIPTNSLLVLNETDRFLKKEFMEGVTVLGAGKRHILKKHLIPFLIPQLIMIYMRELIQVLLIMAHLGILRIFVGGMDVKEDMFRTPREYSLSNEWSGLLGLWWEFIWTGYPWITFIPVLAFTLTILAGKMTLTGFERELSRSASHRKRTRTNTKRPARTVNVTDFTQLSSKS